MITNRTTSLREFEKGMAELVNEIRTKATPFPSDTPAKRKARVERSKRDKFFFASTYFPHYIQLGDDFKELWKDPAAQVDWVKAGFAPMHQEFFDWTKLNNEFVLLAAFRESAKDTLLGKIDVVHKIVSEDCWFIPIIAFSHDHASTKVVPIKLEFENNERLKSDFGEMKGIIKWGEDEFITSNNRKVKAYGRDESLRGQEHQGHRPDWIIMNDLEDPTKTTNPALIRKYVESIRQDILKSVNSPRWGAILLCNYVSKQSVVHELMTGEYTAHYKKPIFRALVINERKTPQDRDLAHQCRLRKLGDGWKSAWEFRHPTVRLLEEQRNDPETFGAEMMMIPKDRKNQKFKDTDFKYYTSEQLARTEIISYTAIDPSAKEASDYKAIITLGVSRTSKFLEIYVVNAWIQQLSVDALLEETYRDFETTRSKIIGVEMIGFASLLEREYRRLMKEKGKPLPIHPIEKVDNKEARIEGLVPLIRSGIIRFNPEQGDQALLIRQFKGFPSKTPVARGGIGDDGPDALALCVRLIQDFPHGTEIEYETGQEREAVFAPGAY